LNASCDIFCEGTTTGLALQGGFAMTTRLGGATLFDVAFKATKLKFANGGTFNAAVAAGVRFNLGLGEMRKDVLGLYSTTTIDVRENATFTLTGSSTFT